jgi:lambda family phage portal protein
MAAANVTRIDRRRSTILDHHGRSMASTGLELSGSSPLYEASGIGRRLRGWNPGVTGPNTALIYESDTLRARCRDMVRKNPWAVSALNSSVANVVGDGIKPQSQAPAPYNKQIIDLWNDSVNELDSAGRCDFYGLQSLIWRSVLEGGEALIRMRPRLPEDGLAVPIQAQALEAEHLPEHYNMQLDGGNVARAGVEFDLIGRRVAYWLYREHPGDRALFISDNLIPVRVPSFVSGIPNVLHVYPLLRPGQMRGLPWLTPVLARLYEIDQCEDADLVKRKVQNLYGAFVKKNAPDDSIAGEDTENNREASVDLELQPGTFQVLLPGEDLVFADPHGDAADAEAFIRVALRAIAAGLGITYEQLTGDMTGVNYSSARVALLEFRRLCAQYQRQVMVFQFCQPFFNAWLDAAVIGGALTLPGYAQNPRPYRRVEWHPPRWDWVSPKDDIAAERAAVEACFKSRAAVINEMGYDEEAVDEEIAADHEREQRLGINPIYGTVRISETIAEPPGSPATQPTKPDGAALTNSTGGQP